MANFDDMKLAVEAMSGGKNTVLYDDMGMPSIMVPWPKQKNKDLFTGGSDIVHPGSIVDEVEKLMYISKFANIVTNDRAYSLPFQDPRTYVNFDQAVSYCRNKGKGWGVTPMSLWAQIALWCRKNGTMPRGNNSYGADHAYAHEKGIPVTYEGDGRTAHCTTGSGPSTWNHNWLPDGIADLNGNVWEWCAGFRIKDGEIQIIPNADCMKPDTNMSATSTVWKAIKADGTLTDPGASGTLKYDWVSGKVQLTSGTITYTTDQGNGSPYNTMGIASGLTPPEIVKALIVYPDEPNGDYGGDYHWLNTRGERVPFCGGSWDYGSSAGVFSVDLNVPRSFSSSDVGFRSAFCEL